MAPGNLQCFRKLAAEPHCARRPDFIILTQTTFLRRHQILSPTTALMMAIAVGTMGGLKSHIFLKFSWKASLWLLLGLFRSTSPWFIQIYVSLVYSDSRLLGVLRSTSPWSTLISLSLVSSSLRLLGLVRSRTPFIYFSSKFKSPQHTPRPFSSDQTNRMISHLFSWCNMIFPINSP